ncbi:MAG: response regulator [Thermoanaerobaculia bacterium]
MSVLSKKRGRVLFVDDEPELLAGMKALLGMEGIDVFVHDSMITLPLILPDVDPDIVLLDLSLPALSGTSALRSGLRKLLRTDGAVLLFSGRSPNELSNLANELGADGFISKTEDSMEIVRRVQTWIDRRRLKRANDRSEGTNAANHTAFAVAR